MRVLINWEIVFAIAHLRLYLQPRKGKAGAVAQSVEQRTENPCVAGSIPAHTTNKSDDEVNIHDRFLFLMAPLVLQPQEQSALTHI